MASADFSRVFQPTVVHEYNIVRQQRFRDHVSQAVQHVIARHVLIIHSEKCRPHKCFPRGADTPMTTADKTLSWCTMSVVTARHSPLRALEIVLSGIYFRCKNRLKGIVRLDTTGDYMPSSISIPTIDYSIDRPATIRSDSCALSARAA